MEDAKGVQGSQLPLPRGGDTAFPGRRHALKLIEKVSFNRCKSATPAHLHVFLIVTHHGHCWASCRAFVGLLPRPPACAEATLTSALPAFSSLLSKSSALCGTHVGRADDFDWAELELAGALETLQGR